MVLGLDLGLACTGWALLAGRTGEAEPVGAQSGVLRPHKLRGGERLKWFWEELEALVEGAQVTEVAIEDYVLGQARRNPRTLASSAELGGVARAVAGGVPTRLWGPGAWRKQVFGRDVGKEEGVAEARIRWGYVARYADEVEARCIARASWERGAP